MYKTVKKKNTPLQVKFLNTKVLSEKYKVSEIIEVIWQKKGPWYIMYHDFMIVIPISINNDDMIVIQFGSLVQWFPT